MLILMCLNQLILLKSICNSFTYGFSAELFYFAECLNQIVSAEYIAEYFLNAYSRQWSLGQQFADDRDEQSRRALFHYI